MKSKEKQVFERIAARQLVEEKFALRASQNFTYEGLLELHAKTFRDDYNHSIEVSDYFAEYDRVRDFSPDGAWAKNRPIPSYGNSLTIYSPMGDEDVARVNGALKACSP